MDVANKRRVTLDSVELELNGNKTHPIALTRDYLMKRSKAKLFTCGYKDGFVKDGGTEELYVVPFCISPESLNPTGHINFSKVTNPRLHLNLTYQAAKGSGDRVQTDFTAGDELLVDIYGVSYNHIVIDQGRMHKAFV